MSRDHEARSGSQLLDLQQYGGTGYPGSTRGQRRARGGSSRRMCKWSLHAHAIN